MARGWESKSVEDQISQKESQSNKPLVSNFTRDQVEQLKKREGLLLSRRRTLTDMELARDDRHRALLERTLAHLDSELVELERT